MIGGRAARGVVDTPTPGKGCCGRATRVDGLRDRVCWFCAYWYHGRRLCAPELCLWPFIASVVGRGQSLEVMGCMAKKELTFILKEKQLPLDGLKMFALLQNFIKQLEADHIKRLNRLVRKRKVQMKKTKEGV